MINLDQKQNMVIDMAERRNNLNRGLVDAGKCIAFSAASLLGPNKCVKCIIDEDNNFELTSDVLRVLKIIKVDHPAISVIHDVCNGFSKAYGTGCSTLLFMIGTWLQTLEVLNDQNIPIPLINHLLDEAVFVCISEAQKLSFPVSGISKTPEQPDFPADQLIASGKERQNFSNRQTDIAESRTVVGNSSTQGLCLKNPILNEFRANLQNPNEIPPSPSNVFRLAIKYSRHIAETYFTNREEQALHLLASEIKTISKGVARGNKVIEDLLIKLLELSKHSKRCVKRLVDLKLPLERIFVESLDGKADDESNVFEGICAIASNDTAEEACHLLDQRSLKVCLIDFDKARHCVMERKNQNDSDFDRIVCKLKHFQISCIIYKGESKTLQNLCMAGFIIALKVNSSKILDSLSIATGNPILSSFNELTLQDIGLPVMLSLVGNVHQSSISNKKQLLRPVISVKIAKSQEKYYTVLLCGTTPNTTVLLEEKFWTSIHRLNNIFKVERYLHGAGWIEKKCIEKLMCSTGNTYQTAQYALTHWLQQEACCYRRSVFSEVAKGLERFCLQLSHGFGQLEVEDVHQQVMDDLQSKCEAWKRAIKLVNFISRVDIVLTKNQFICT